MKVSIIWYKNSSRRKAIIVCKNMEDARDYVNWEYGNFWFNIISDTETIYNDEFRKECAR